MADAKHDKARRSAGIRSSAGAVYRIEGETVSVDEIAERIGVSNDTARSRMYRLRKASGAITWERLRK